MRKLKLGTFEQRLSDAISYPGYAYGMYSAAPIKFLRFKKISVIEFGVARKWFNCYGKSC